MPEEIIVDQCSPTMAGIKTGNLFTTPAEDKETFTRELREINKLLVPKGLRLLPLKYTPKYILLYMYRIEDLKKDLNTAEARNILRDRAYPLVSADLCVVELAKRLRRSEDFPHEIGLFLGYPPEDVEAFIKNKGKGEKLTGTWKVYCDVENARCTFDRFKRCKGAYMEAYRHNRSIDRLIVSCS
jgi:hypothetical protein